jgi:predicted esterase
LQGKNVFLAHGTQDSLVPVDRARQAAATLQEAGADVILCEDEVGHKLSASCFRNLQDFISGERK